jgi:hypothetical protein
MKMSCEREGKGTATAKKTQINRSICKRITIENTDKNINRLSNSTRISLQMKNSNYFKFASLKRGLWS